MANQEDTPARLDKYYPNHNRKERQEFAHFPRKRAEEMREDYEEGNQLEEDELELQRLAVLLNVLKINSNELELANVPDFASLDSFVADANATSMHVKNTNPGASVKSTSLNMLTLVQNLRMFLCSREPHTPLSLPTSPTYQPNLTSWQRLSGIGSTEG